MSSNRLKMNADKTQLIWLGTRLQLDKLTTTELDLLSVRIRFSTTVSDLDVLVNCQLSMADHVARTVSAVSVSVTPTQADAVIANHRVSKDFRSVHAFVSSRLEYCNSLLYGVSDDLVQKLRVMQNVVTGAMQEIQSQPLRCCTNFAG